MIRKMQSKAQTQPLLDTDTLNLYATVASVALIVATVIVMLFVSPANAAHPHQPPAQQLTVWTDALPDNFQIISADAGLDVIEIDRLVSLGSHVLVVQSIHGDTPELLLKKLNATFPSLVFTSMNDSEEGYELVSN